MKINKNILGRTQYVLPYTKSYRHKLDIIENQSIICPSVAEKLTAVDVHLYPAHGEIYEKLVNAVAVRAGVVSDNIILTNGSDNGLKLLIEAYAVPDMYICVPTPTYPHFVSFAQNVNTLGIVGPNITRDMSPDDICGKIAETLQSYPCNCAYICSPNLPLGYSLSSRAVESLVRNFPNTMFIIDEAYFEYGYVESSARLVRNFANISVTRTFSKAFGLAGLRIGYIIAPAVNMSHLSVLVNDKNVTSQATTAALAVMENIKYYEGLIARDELLKQHLREELYMCVRECNEIYDYNVSGGNFFLIFARNPPHVYEIFASHGIYIRDKSSEVPGALRIALGTETQMREVLLIIKFINLKWILRNNPIVFDLDNTLRAGSKRDGDFYDCSHLANYDSWVCSNNCVQTPEEIHEVVNLAGINIPAEKIITPLVVLSDIVSKYDFKPFVIGSQSAREYLGAGDVESSNCVIVCGVYFTADNIVNACKLIERGAPLYYTDSSEYTTLDSCTEVDDRGAATIPDMGAFIKLFPADPIYVGKPGAINEYIPKGVFVGDSISTDAVTADAVGSLFIHVGATSIPYCNLDCNYIELPGIEFLEKN